MLTREVTRRKILVVDDDRAILELVTVRLTLDGYDVFTAREGREGLQRLQGVRPDAMVLDLNMPVLDGFGVLTQLGKTGTARTPILVLTARHDAADVQRAISMGARDYLAKPFKDSQLLMRMARLFRARPDPRGLGEVMSAMDELLVGRTGSADFDPSAHLPK
jgi:DNA-binding response OmpR family regulator